MASNKNIFCATNPAALAQALWIVMGEGKTPIDDMLIFLPSRRAVRTVEQMIADKMGGAAILPRMVALGEGADEIPDDDGDDLAAADVVSDTMRVCMAAKLIAADANVGNIAAALPVARDLVRMTDYLENEGVDAAAVDWAALVDAKYAAHFQAKAAILNIIASVMPSCGGAGVTRAARRNADIRAWIDVIRRGGFSRVIVCGSTASVPATADLMAAVAEMECGRIILPGRISGRADDFCLDTNPYNCEYKFLSRLCCSSADVREIDVGASAMDFFNRAFGNVVSSSGAADLSHCHMIECAREAEEAAVAVHVAANAAAAGQSVLIITPDAAGNQRLRAAFAAAGIAADFSGGVSGTATAAGRAILNMLDAWIEKRDDTFERRMAAAGGRLFDMISAAVADMDVAMAPAFDINDDDAAPVWDALYELSRCIEAAGIELTVGAARAFVADALAGVTVRCTPPDGTRISVLGTIESRMQTADVVILTGLNEGMFPARGYENAWLPAAVQKRIGCPPADRKVALMALDFMTLSCGRCVYWTRSLTAGGAATTESRFISRVLAHRGNIDTAAGAAALDAVRRRDMPAARPLRPGRAAPPADWSDVYVTELELLIHNPYAFYAKHILRLRPMDDWWAGADMKTFGNLVHDVIEHAHDFSPDALQARLMDAARDKVGADSVLYRFWLRRFAEIAPVVARVLGRDPGRAEILGRMVVPVGMSWRRVLARADRVCDGVVMDIKTGAAPGKKQLADGMMPQLPLEAHMLRTGGFDVPAVPDNAAPRMMFLQLRAGDVRVIEYDPAQTGAMIDAALEKVDELFRIYTAGGAEYEYRETGDKKYKAYDDLARVDD